jgi:diguanylate cyclase (GGDEF)-like protein
VPNRRKFKEVLASRKEPSASAANHQISVLMIDIDFFKGFNVRFGTRPETSPAHGRPGREFRAEEA